MKVIDKFTTDCVHSHKAPHSSDLTPLQNQTNSIQTSFTRTRHHMARTWHHFEIRQIHYRLHSLAQGTTSLGPDTTSKSDKFTAGCIHSHKEPHSSDLTPLRNQTNSLQTSLTRTRHHTARTWHYFEISSAWRSFVLQNRHLVCTCIFHTVIESVYVLSCCVVLCCVAMYVIYVRPNYTPDITLKSTGPDILFIRCLKAASTASYQQSFVNLQRYKYTFL